MKIMKKLFGLILATLFGLSLTSCGTSVGFYDNADKYLIGNQTYTENITSLDIDWISGKVILIEDETIEGVKVEEDTNLVKDEELVHSYLNNGELKIKFFASGHSRMGFTSFKKDLTVTYKPGLENFELNLTSGSCTATKLTATNCDIDMTSGSIKIDNLVANNISTECTSGDIEINNADVKELKSTMTSGNINVSFVNLEKADFDMTSGDINMTLPEEGGIVKVNKTSGTVITKRECTVDKNTYTFGSGDASIKVSMTSGTVVIK